MFTVLYLQSAVVMMDSLILLPIISHTHTYNNNEVIFYSTDAFGLHRLHNSSLGTVYMNRHGKCCNTARPPRSKCANQLPNTQSRSYLESCVPVPTGTESRVLGPA